MAATYDITLPTAKDRIRHSLGDTDMTGPLRQDETYAALLAAYSETEATAVLAEALAAEYAQQPVRITDKGTTVDWGDRVKTWLALAARLRAALAETAATSSNTMRILRPVRYDDWGDHSEYVRLAWWSPS